MSLKSTNLLALIVLASGLAAPAAALAGEGTVMLGSDGFADRCYGIGGDLLDAGEGYGCDLGSTVVECVFSGIYADCAWNGPQNKREVIRLIGMADAAGLTTSSDGSVGKKKGGGIQLPDLPLNNK